MAAGTLVDPFTLADALVDPRIQPNHTLWMRGGVYSGEFVATLQGAITAPITLRPYQNEHVEIDGTLNLQAARYLEVLDCDIHWTGWTSRTSLVAGSAAVGIGAPSTTGSGVTLGTGCKLINCTVLDEPIGVAAFSGGYSLYGTLILNNGWLGPDRGHGHALYTHNDQGVLDTIQHNLIMRQFDRGLHLYSGSTNKIQYYDILENVLTRGQVVGDTGGWIRNIRVEGNLGYKVQLDAAYVTLPYVNALTLRDNRLHGISTFKSWANAEARNNVFIYRSELEYIMRIKFPPDWTLYDWNENTYYGPAGVPLVFGGYDWQESYLTLATWQAATGFDLNSQWINSLAPDTVHVFPNAYAAESKRKALVAVFNWTEAESVSVDLGAAGLVNGTQYKLIQAQDPFVDVVTFTYTGAALTIDMRAVSHSVAVPYAHSVALDSTTFPWFGAFIIELAL